MSARREPSKPPVIPGYTFIRVLGMGGFADVFLYEQQMPRRSVAVKVLLAAHLSDEVRARFRGEAGLMAQLSHHPSIVTIHHADMAVDGRPFLVMEYCSRAGLGQRYRSERMGVAEVLRIGVRLAAAVETAHRAGILHRDIKPANVLVTDFGWPALTDFGIAATTLAAGSAMGMSIPWSPPEMLTEDPRGDERADVYSLAATVYSLLARRSPFEVPDGANSAADLIDRIERAPLAPVGRGDVPESLEAVLARAMAKDPARRYPSAVAFARALQQVEAELMLPLTTLDLPEDEELVATRPGPGAPYDDQATRLRPVQVVRPDGEPAPATGATSSSTGPAAGTAVTAGAGPAAAGAPAASSGAATRGGTLLQEHADIPEEWRRQAAEVAAAAPAAPPRRPVGKIVAGVVAALLVIAALVVAGTLALGRRTPVQEEPESPTARPTQPVLAVPAPTELSGEMADDGSATFTWTNPDPLEGDQYLWGIVTPGVQTTLEVVTEPMVTLPDFDVGGGVCIEVSILREDRRYSTTPAVECVP